MRSLLTVGLLVCLTIAGCGGGSGGSGGGGTLVTNRAPVANAGPVQNVAAGSTVTLDGSGCSDADGDLLTYAWSFVSIPAGSQAALSNMSAVNPSFTADFAGSYVLSLVVHDGTVASAASTVTVVAATGNSAPVANAGPDQNVATGSVATLSGSGSSDADGDPLTYLWTITSVPVGSGVNALSSGTVVSPTFIADVDGAYVFSLIVNDGTVSSAADSVTVTAATANSAPVADAGPDQYVITGSLVTLDGSASSDADSDPLTYAWTLVSRPDGSSATLSSTTAGNPTFTADVDGFYVFSLVVNDGTVASAADTVVINSVADYSSLFQIDGQAVILTSGTELYLAGSDFSAQIKNISNMPFDCTRAELRYANLVQDFTEDPAFLSSGQIDPGEMLVSRVILDNDVQVDPDNDFFEFRYYLTRSDTGENFIVFHRY